MSPYCETCEGESTEFCRSECQECGAEDVHTSKGGDGFEGWCAECVDNYEPSDEEMCPSEWGPTIAERQAAAQRLK